MSPPAGPGQSTVLKTHYARLGTGPVAFLDETYHVEKDDRRRFYVMAAVVVLHEDLDPLRNELDSLVPDAKRQIKLLQQQAGTTAPTSATAG